MSDFVFNVKGLTAQDRTQWEKDNIEKLDILKMSLLGINLVTEKTIIL